MAAGETTSDVPLLTMPRARSNRYHSLDLWRGLACLLVAVFHASYYLTFNPMPRPHDRVSDAIFRVVQAMWVGVPIFFVISGYCITAACDNLRERGFGVRQYFVRRFRRIYPPYWAAVGFLLLVGLIFRWTLHGGVLHTWVHPAPDPEPLGMYTRFIQPVPNPKEITPGQWIGNLTLTETWRYHVAGNPGSYFDKFFLGPGWSLCYEEQFYAICGLALFLAPRRFFQIMVGITAAVVAVTTANALALRYWSRTVVSSEGFFWDGRWLTFAAGILVYYRVNYTKGWRGRLVDGVFALLLAAAVGRCLWENGGVNIYEHSQRRVLIALWHGLLEGSRIWSELWPGILFAMGMVVLHQWDVALATSRPLRPLMFCGRISYSLYLIHWPVVKVVGMLFFWRGVRGPWQTLFMVVPLGVGLAILAGWMFHQLVERRFLNPPVRPAAGGEKARGGLSNAGAASAAAGAAVAE